MQWTTRIARLCLTALLLLGLFAAPSSASIIVEDTFPTGQGFVVFGFDPDAPELPPFGRSPGRAYEFRTNDAVELDAIEVALNLYAGANEVDISLHDAEPYFDKVRPGSVIETFHLSGALAAETQTFTLQSLLQPTLAADTSYFLSVTTEETFGEQVIRWAAGDPSDSGFVRAYMRADRSWDTYVFTTFPRAAFRVIAVPEPSTMLLLALGLACLSRVAPVR